MLKKILIGLVVIIVILVVVGFLLPTEYEVERFYRDAKVAEIYEGTKEIQKNTIASQLIKEL